MCSLLESTGHCSAHDGLGYSQNIKETLSICLLIDGKDQRSYLNWQESKFQLINMNFVDDDMPI